MSGKSTLHLCESQRCKGQRGEGQLCMGIEALLGWSKACTSMRPRHFGMGCSQLKGKVHWVNAVV